MKIYIRDLVDGLSRWPFNYLELETGEVFDWTSVPERYRNDETVFMKLPSYTAGWIRQMFIEEKIKNGEIKDHYDLLSYPRFVLADISEQHGSIEEGYIHKVHCLCEENGIEDCYYDFALEHLERVAREWCDQRGFPYCEGFSFDDPERSGEAVNSRIAAMWGEDSFESFAENKHPLLVKEYFAILRENMDAYRKR